MDGAREHANPDDERSTNRTHEAAQWALVTHSVNRFFSENHPVK